jgi:hypothetical protein
MKADLANDPTNITWKILNVSEVQGGMLVMVQNKWRRVLERTSKLTAEDKTQHPSAEYKITIDGLPQPLFSAAAAEFMVQYLIKPVPVDLPPISETAAAYHQTADPASLINAELRVTDDGGPDS